MLHLKGTNVLIKSLKVKNLFTLTFNVGPKDF